MSAPAHKPQALTPRRIDSLKADAKKLKKSEGITHAEALDKVAIQRGFQSWAALVAASSDAQREKDEG